MEENHKYRNKPLSERIREDKEAKTKEKNTNLNNNYEIRDQNDSPIYPNQLSKPKISRG